MVKRPGTAMRPGTAIRPGLPAKPGGTARPKAAATRATAARQPAPARPGGVPFSHGSQAPGGPPASTTPSRTAPGQDRYKDMLAGLLR
jgi:hypothetical protein